MKNPKGFEKMSTKEILIKKLKDKMQRSPFLGLGYVGFASGGCVW
jgi:hypothetical protein